jgi:ABC-2 type transport system permease protein
MTEKITFGRVVRSEWTKLRSLRSTGITLGATGLLTVGLAGAIGYGVNRAVSGGEPVPTVADAVSAAFLPIDFFVLVIGVFGVLQMSGEYGTGLIRATLTAVPRRLPVLAAKALVQVALTGPVMAVVCLASFLACQAFLGDEGASLSDPGVPGAIVGAAACPVLMGLLGLGIGTMVRHTAGAITTLVAGAHGRRPATVLLVPWLARRGVAVRGDPRRRRWFLRGVPRLAAPLSTLRTSGRAAVSAVVDPRRFVVMGGPFGCLCRRLVRLAIRAGHHDGVPVGIP